MPNSEISQQSDLKAISKATEQDSTDDPTTSTTQNHFKDQAALTFLGRDFINNKIGWGSSVALGSIEGKTIEQSRADLLGLLEDTSAMESLLLSDDSDDRLNQIRGKIQPNKGEAPECLKKAQERNLIQHKAAEEVGSRIPDKIRGFLRQEAPSLMATASTRDHINKLLGASDFSGTDSAQDTLLTIADLGFVNLLMDLGKKDQSTLLKNYSTFLKKRGLRTAGSRLLVSFVTIPSFAASITPALVWVAGIFLPGFQISAMTSNILMISALSCIGLSLISGLIGWYLSHTGIEPLLSKLNEKHPEMIELAAKIGVVEPKLRDRLEAEYQKHHPSVKKYRSRIRRITRALGVPMIIASIAWASYLLTPLINHTQDVAKFISTITPSSLIVIGSLFFIGAVILGIGLFLSRALELKQLKARVQTMCPKAYNQFMQKKQAHQNELNRLYESITTAVDPKGLATGQALNPGNVELFNYQITHEKQRFQEGLNQHLTNNGHQSLHDISYNEATRQWVVTIQKTGQAHYYDATNGTYLEPSDELKITQAMQLFLYQFEQQLTSQESSTQEKLDATWRQLSEEFSEHADTIKTSALHNPTTAFQWMQENLEQRLERHFMAFVEQIGKNPDTFEGFLSAYRAAKANKTETVYIQHLRGTEEISQEASNTLDTYQALSELKEKHSSTLHATIAQDHCAAVQALAQYLTQENATLTADQIERLKSIQGSRFLSAQLTTELQARRPSIQAYLQTQDELKFTQAMQLFLYQFEQQLTSQESSTQEKLDATWIQLSEEFSEHADTIKTSVLHNPITAFQWMQENLEQRLERHFMAFVEQIGKNPDTFEGFLSAYRAEKANKTETVYIQHLRGTEEISQEASNTLDTYQALSELKEKHLSTLHATIAQDHCAAVQALAQYLTQENATLTADQIESEYQALTDLNEHDLQQELDKKIDSIQAWLIRKGSSETPEQLKYLIDRYTSDRKGTLEVIVEDVQDGLSPSAMALHAIQTACESEGPLTLTQDQYHALSDFNATELEQNLARVTGYQNRGNLIQQKGRAVYFKDLPLIYYTETGREALEAISSACKSEKAPTLTQDQYHALSNAGLTHDAGALNTALNAITHCQNSEKLIQKMGLLDSTVCFKGIPLIRYTDTVREALKAISSACESEGPLTLTQDQYHALSNAGLTHDAGALNTALKAITHCQNSEKLIQKMGLLDSAVGFNRVPLTMCIETQLAECPHLDELSAAALAPSQTPPATAGPAQSSETSVNDTPHP